MTQRTRSAPPSLGVLGGTFDPVHLGHLVLAQYVRQALSLPRMLLLPASVPPHKTGRHLTADHHRQEMLSRAIDGWSGLELCTLELEAGGVCYTIDTLRRLRTGPPPSRPLFVLGMDSLVELPTWREYGRLVAEFDLIVVDRPGSDPEEASRRLGEEIFGRIVRLSDTPLARDPLRELDPGRGGRILHVAMTPIAISSSDIRRRVARGESLVGLVPPAVAGYIRSAGLYR